MIHCLGKLIISKCHALSIDEKNLIFLLQSLINIGKQMESYSFEIKIQELNTIINLCRIINQVFLFLVILVHFTALVSILFTKVSQPYQLKLVATFLLCKTPLAQVKS